MPDSTELPASNTLAASAAVRPLDLSCDAPARAAGAGAAAVPPTEVGGPGGPDPTRYGDWERRGRCIDF